MKTFNNSSPLEASFEAEVVDGVTVIYDTGLENRSVTNDIEGVLRRIKNAGLLQPHVVYMDSDGRWDGVKHVDGVFFDFIMLDEHEMREAVEAIQKKQVIKA